ncbi:MAG TPA: LysR substrate-binding domain-containing protein [Bradyrhizobium sp.]|jgi:DNA-binding transcriptional LysR family regulator|uniref:LysR family transcriptional regulator n=1 Tax=Bradyrhizobium sp. TaxID=376 RepID=UPI002BB1F22D|nr:LysR substrate-binding domain-containing protein [Bradyrhizobium sp.]HXB78276.1 LysR substrate-binding domain-containing protein [Bradyrhizobium sp.]
MTLEQLRIFVAVAEKQHVTQAARELNLTQSATSAAIASLEERYDIKLFDRIGRGIVLTHTGRTFLSEARAVLARARSAEQTLRDITALKGGKVVVAASQTVANYWLPPRLQAFQAAHPGIDVTVRIANTERVANDVREGLADIGFIEGDIDDAALSARRIDGDALVVVIGPRHPFAKHRKLPADWLTQTPWILREPGSGTRDMFERALKKRGLRLSDLAVQLELASNEAIRTAVESGLCATALSDLVVEKSLKANTLVQIDTELAKRSFYVLRHKERHISKAETALLAVATAKPG